LASFTGQAARMAQQRPQGGVSAFLKPLQGLVGVNTPPKPLRGFVLPILGKGIAQLLRKSQLFLRKRACQALAGHFSDFRAESAELFTLKNKGKNRSIQENR
jgi:hypothetical protein